MKSECGVGCEGQIKMTKNKISNTRRMMTQPRVLQFCGYASSNESLRRNGSGYGCGIRQDI